MKTPSVNIFDYLFLSAVIIEIFTVIAGWDYIVLTIHNQVSAQGGGPDMQVFYSNAAPWFIMLSFAASFALWAFIAVFRLGFFRYVFALFVAIEVLSLVLEYLDPVGSLWFLVSGCITTGLKIAATIFVFRDDAGAWLRREV